MTNSYDSEKNEIHNALIREYVRQNPGIREQDVVMMSENGQLIFSDLAAVLAEMKVRKDFQACIQSTSKMTASLAIEENKRWQDCSDSAQQGKLFIDCLTSSPFNLYDRKEWSTQHNYIRRYESIAARATVHIEKTKQEIQSFRRQGLSVRTPHGRKSIIFYLQYVVDQLNGLHKLLDREASLGDQFEESASRFLDMNFEHIQKEAAPFKLLNNIFRALTGDKKAKLTPDDITELNRSYLVETKNTLTSAVTTLRSRTETRRKMFQEIWLAISELKSAIKGLEELNRQDEAGKLGPEDVGSGDEASSPSRMARFISAFKN